MTRSLRTNQEQIITNVANRGYFDKWTPAALLKRQAVILLEECCELFLSANWPDTREFNELRVLAKRTGELAKSIFKDRNQWVGVSVAPGEIEAMRWEKADVTVVAASLHFWWNDETGERTDFFHDAEIKSRADVDRGTSYKGNGK